MRNTENKSKKAVAVILIFMAAVLLLSLIFLIIVPFFTGSLKAPDKRSGGNITFYPADYEHNIFGDEEYMQEERRILYTEGGQSRFLTEEEYNINDNPVLLFLSKYFEFLINGDAENLKACYSDRMVKALDLPDAITMQRLYDINIEYISVADKVGKGGDEYYEYQYKIDYKIMRNDGTFRRDIESRSSKPQYFVIKYNMDNIEITDVINTK